MSISIKSTEELKTMREANQIVARTHELLSKAIKPGVTTGDLNQLALDYIASQGAKPSFLNYHGYPGAICASVNEEVVHGIPGDRVIRDGDVVSIDIGALYKGYHGDAARSYTVGNASEEAKRLVRVTKESFFEGMKYAKPGCHLHQISAAIQKHIESNGYSVVRDLVGHGIGKALHEDPQIPNYKPMGRGPKLRPGMTLAIEPMVNAGRFDVRTLSDDWTVVTLDGSLSAHYENTIVITDTGHDLLTMLEQSGDMNG